MTIKRMTKSGKVYCALIVLIPVLACLGLHLFAAPEATPDLLDRNGKEAFNLFAHWSQGNVVVLIRHAERCDRSEHQCLQGDSGITVPGRAMALALGRDIKALLMLDNATIYNSPVKRTKQTAGFMFGAAASDRMWLREGCKKNLLRDIFASKQPGKNLLLVTHATCIDRLGEADGEKLIELDFSSEKTYGISIFLAVDREARQAYVLGYLYPGDWSKLLQRKR